MKPIVRLSKNREKVVAQLLKQLSKQYISKENKTNTKKHINTKKNL